MSSWSYDLTLSLYEALNGCDLLPSCALIWPGCTPPLDKQLGDCESTLWVTFTEALIAPRPYGDGCVEPQQAVSITLWVRQCNPTYDTAGTLPPVKQIFEQVAAQAEYRNQIMGVVARWAAAQSDGCPGWGYTGGQWVCATTDSGLCSTRQLTITLTR